MPALSPTMTTGNIGTWHKKIGDAIQPGDVLVEIETDKAQMDFECQDEGFLAQIFIESGAKDVPVNKPVAILVEDQKDVAAFANYAAPASLPTELPPTAVPSSSAPAPAPHAPLTPAPALSPTPTPTPTPSPATPVSQSQPEDRVFASPLARALAVSRGIDIASVRGSGPGGRIVKSDVDSYSPTAPAPTPVTPLASPAAPAPVASSTSSYIDLPLTNMRKVIASRLTLSKQSIPHYYLTVEIQMDKLLKLRQLLNSSSSSSSGNGEFKLSVNDFVVKASALALVAVPQVNSAWQDSFIRQFRSADICIAVATEAGLITPIVPAAEARGLASISNKIKELAAKAKDNKLKPDEYQGGSFTISNLGMFGVDAFTAIINPPQAAILAVGSTMDKVVLDTESGSVKNTKAMKVTLSCDHRVVDGAVAAKWLAVFKSKLEEPLTLML